MIKRKLKRLKRAEENRILKEHEGLYSRIAEENYPKTTPAKKIDKRLIWIPTLAGALAVFLCTMGVWASVVIHNGLGGTKGDMMNAASGSVSGSQDGNENNNDDLGDAMGGLNGINGAISLTQVENMLGSSTLAESGLKFRQITAQENAYGTVIELEADTLHTLKLAVALDGGRVSEEYLPVGEVKSLTNEHGFQVEYSFTRRKQEDFYTYKTTATVYTDTEVYYIRYNYSSSSRECELLQVISSCISPKA